MAELYDKATGKHLAAIPDNELKDIVFAQVITFVSRDFDDTLEGEMMLEAGQLDRALRDLDTDPLLDSLKRPTLETLRSAIDGDKEAIEVRFKKDKV